MQASRIAKSEERENLFIFYRFLKSKNNLLLKALPEVVLSLNNKDFFSAKTNHFRMLSFFVKYFFRKKKFRNKNIYFFLLFFVSFRPGCFSVSSGLLRAFAFSELSFRFRTFSKLEPTDPSGRKIFMKPKWVIFAGHPVTLSVFLIYYSSVEVNPAALRIEKTI